MTFEDRLKASGYEVFDPYVGALCREDRNLHHYSYLETDPGVWTFQKRNSAHNLIKEIVFIPHP